MICICYQRQLELLARFAHLPSNAGSALEMPANVLPATAALNSSLTNASSALAADQAAEVGAESELAASPQAAAAAALSANPQLAAAAELSALAGATSGMKSSLGIDLNSPGAGEDCAKTWAMIPALMQTLAALPLHLEPKLAEIAKVGELSDKLKDQLGVDLQSPSWAGDLSDSVAEKVAEAQQAANDAQQAAGDALASASEAAKSVVPGAPEIPSGSLEAPESASSTTDLMAATETTVQTGLGVDLSAPGGVEELGAKLETMKGTLNGMPSAMAPADTGLILATMQMLVTIDALRRTLGIDVLAPGAGESAQSKLDSLSSNLSAAPQACAALDNAAGASSELGSNASGSGSATGAGSLGGSGSGSAGAALGGSASSSTSGSAASNASAEALGSSALANPALAQMMAGMPGVPVPWVLLTALCAQVKATLGIQLIAHGPCG